MIVVHTIERLTEELKKGLKLCIIYYSDVPAVYGGVTNTVFNGTAVIFEKGYFVIQSRALVVRTPQESLVYLFSMKFVEIYDLDEITYLIVNGDTFPFPDFLKEFTTDSLNSKLKKLINLTKELNDTH